METNDGGDYDEVKSIWQNWKWEKKTFDNETKKKFYRKTQANALKSKKRHWNKKPKKAKEISFKLTER